MIKATATSMTRLLQQHPQCIAFGDDEIMRPNIWEQQVEESYRRPQVLDQRVWAEVGRVVCAAREHTARLVNLCIGIARSERKQDALCRSHEQLRELSARLQSVREEECARIACEIHDDLGQILTGLKMDVVWLQKRLDEHQRPMLEKTQAMSALIDTAVQRVRQIASELRPALLDSVGLVAAIEWQLHEFQSRTGVQCTLTCATEDTTLDAEGVTAVFRIFQEILTNVARHAGATQVEVSLEESASHVTLQMRDNGRGITHSELRSPKSIGLLGMQERAHRRAGEVWFQGTPGQGTTVTVCMPLERSAER